MVVVLLGGAAVLTDVSWWWVNEQGMQRAADAGALAGAIYLPGDRATAYAKAYEEAAKNGYVDGEDGVVVTPSVDAGDPRQLNVDIAGPVSTSFAKVFSIDSIDAAVVGSATYVLPVPMGSPQRYYGVGFFQSKTPAGSASTQPAAPSDVLGGTWAHPERAFVLDESPTVLYATARPVDASREDYGGFGIDLPAGATVAGIEVRLEAWGSDHHRLPGARVSRGRLELDEPEERRGRHLAAGDDHAGHPRRRLGHVGAKLVGGTGRRSPARARRIV